MQWESGLMAWILTLTPVENDVPYVVSDPTPELSQKMQALKSRLLHIRNAFPEPLDLEALYSADEPAQRPVIEALLESEVMQHFNAYSEAMHDMVDF
jgi:hypothetical protein